MCDHDIWFHAHPKQVGKTFLLKDGPFFFLEHKRRQD